MPRGEGGEFSPNLQNVIDVKNPNTGGGGSSLPLRAGGVTGPGRFTDPLTGKRYSGRAGGFLNPILLRQKNFKSLIAQGWNPIRSLVSAFDPLGIRKNGP